MKDSGIVRLGLMPEDWTASRVKYIYAVIGSGTTPSSGNAQYYDGSENWIQSGDLYKTKYVTQTEKTVTDFAVSTISALHKYKADFIIIAMYGASIGNVAISKIDACVNQACCVIKPNSKIHFNYLYYTLVNDRDIMLDMSIGGTQPNISQAKILELPVFLPPLPEQKKIADFLDEKCGEIDSIRSDIQKQIDILNDYKKSVITEAVTKGLNPKAKLKDSGIEWIGKIPEGWDTRRLKELGKVRNGLTYSPMDICDPDEGYLVLRSSNIKDGKLSFEDNVFVSCRIPHELIVQKGDILICSRNGSRKLIGKNAIIDDVGNGRVTYGAFMMVFRTKYTKYLYYILNSGIFSYYLGSFFTSTINQLTGFDFGNMVVPFCTDGDEQKAIADCLDEKCSAIDATIADKQRQLETLDEYKKSLIFEYVTGKKEVAQ